MWLLTLKSVLLATDLGEGSLPALHTAVRLATLAGATLHLVHATDASMEAGDAQLREHLARTLPDAPAPGSAQVLRGPPAEAIVERAMEVGADTIILGRHRPGRTPPGEMGSTAAAVVRTAPCPCLVAAAELQLPLQRVLAPIDLSEAAGGTLAIALSWASALRPPGGQAELIALHVAARHDAPPVTERMHREVERARTSAGGAARVEIRELISVGDAPAAEILRQADMTGAQLLVLGSREEGQVDDGGVSAAVVRAAPCPVLLVPSVTWRDQDSR